MPTGGKSRFGVAATRGGTLGLGPFSLDDFLSRESPDPRALLETQTPDTRASRQIGRAHV